LLDHGNLMLHETRWTNIGSQDAGEIRLMAVERVREGESAADVIAAYGFNRTTIYKWLNAALRPGLASRRCARRRRPVARAA
jgi:transposase